MGMRTMLAVVGTAVLLAVAPIPASVLGEHAEWLAILLTGKAFTYLLLNENGASC